MCWPWTIGQAHSEMYKCDMRLLLGPKQSRPSIHNIILTVLHWLYTPVKVHSSQQVDKTIPYNEQQPFMASFSPHTTVHIIFYHCCYYYYSRCLLSSELSSCICVCTSVIYDIDVCYVYHNIYISPETIQLSPNIIRLQMYEKL